MRSELRQTAHRQFETSELATDKTSMYSKVTQENSRRLWRLGGENSAAFPKAGPIFQQPFSVPESAQPLAGIAFRTAGKSGNHFPAASKFAGKPSSKEFRTATAFLSFLSHLQRQQMLPVTSRSQLWRQNIIVLLDPEMWKKEKLVGCQVVDMSG